MNEWIDVNERLPDIKGEYIVAYHPCYWDDVESETKVGIDSFRGGKQKSNKVWAKNKYQRVTHWMPKPLPPNDDDFDAEDILQDILEEEELERHIEGMLMDVIEEGADNA